MKLTETQIKILTPLKKEYDKAHQELTKALFLIAGKTFNGYEIKDDELIILDEKEYADKDIIKP